MTEFKVRTGERTTYKRCQKQWYLAWRRGLRPRAESFGALTLGTWVHHALNEWYGIGTTRSGVPANLLQQEADEAIARAVAAGAPEHVIDRACSQRDLGISMLQEYTRVYGADEKIEILQGETTLQYYIGDVVCDGVRTPVTYELTPDLVYKDVNGVVHIMEHKTAQVIRTGHLMLDDQKRAYETLAPTCLRKNGVFVNAPFGGITYNFIRKAVADTRKRNSDGHALNKDGSVSARQSSPVCKRVVPGVMTRAAQRRHLIAINREVMGIAAATVAIRDRSVNPDLITKTPHYSCERMCPFFSVCMAEEQGNNPASIIDAGYFVHNPYDHTESTDEVKSFEYV